MKTYMTTGRLVMEEQQQLLIEQLRFDLINSEQELAQTQEALDEANAEVNRRAFLVIKAAVEEWRLENGYKNTHEKIRRKKKTKRCKNHSVHPVIRGTKITPKRC